jgi:hypothetical protein
MKPDPSFSCHWYVNSPPEAPMLKLVFPPAQTDMSDGSVRIVGFVMMVSTASIVVTFPHEFVKTAWYRYPFMTALALKLNVVLVAPVMSLQVVPPSTLTCHWTASTGDPAHAAVNVTDAPAQTI